MLEYAYDSETTIRNRGDNAVGNFQASPYHKDNLIVAHGWITPRDGEDVYVHDYDATGVTEVPDFLDAAMRGQQVLLIAHNIGFDLSYLMKEWPEQFWQAAPNLRLWCTMQGAYLLSGQSVQMPSLDELATALGYEQKDDRIAGYWSQGIDTPFIPKDELLEYMEWDVRKCWAVYLDQREKMEQIEGMLQLMEYKMDDIFVSTLMCFNGMRFSVDVAARKLAELDPVIEGLEAELGIMATPFFVTDFKFNPDSTHHVAALLFGGTYSVERVVEVVGEDGQPVVFKGGARKGQVKTRKEDFEYKTKGFALPTKGIPQTQKGYSTSEDVLAKIDHPFTKKLLELRALRKDAETYYRGYSALVWPDGCIHHNLNNEIAATGRQTCSSPNLQNVSKEDD